MFFSQLGIFTSMKLDCSGNGPGGVGWTFWLIWYYTAVADPGFPVGGGANLPERTVPTTMCIYRHFYLILYKYK